MKKEIKNSVRNRDLQPWLDYFGMLQAYERAGYLQTEPARHEAFVTEAALFSLSPGGGTPAAVMQADRMVSGIPDTVRRIRAYACFRSRQGKESLRGNFAVHVVKDDAPHDLLRTLLLERRRPWWWPFAKVERVELIGY